MIKLYTIKSLQVFHGAEVTAYREVTAYILSIQCCILHKK